MEMKIFKTIYIMGASCELMDKVRRSVNYWAEGDGNICMTFENALEVEELKPLIEDVQDGSDVILSH